MGKLKVAFICVHNSCRSQIAAALGKHLASDAFESYPAGTETIPQINQDAVRLMKQLYGIDMEKKRRPKLLSEIPLVDLAVTMGCNSESAMQPYSLFARMEEIARLLCKPCGIRPGFPDVKTRAYAATHFF